MKSQTSSSFTSGFFLALLAAVVMLFIWYLWYTNRVGEITVSTPGGPSMTIKVAESNDISELMRKGLEDKRSAVYLTNSLLSIIEQLKPDSPLSEKLVDLAERRNSPFKFESVPVKIIHDANIERGLVSVCENSQFSAKNIVVYTEDNIRHDMQFNMNVYADPRLTRTCTESGEIVRMNAIDIEGMNGVSIFAKRTL
jgi:hypothetical protein